MRADDVTTDQAQKLYDQVGPMLGYFSRLKEKMEKRFHPKDPLFILVCETHSKLHHLTSELHYLTCKSGVGRPRRD